MTLGVLIIDQIWGPDWLDADNLLNLVQSHTTRINFDSIYLQITLCSKVKVDMKITIEIGGIIYYYVVSV